MIRLVDCFPESGAAPLREIDWDEFGVAIPYVMFFTGRCGSALLNGWLADTGLCGIPDEYFNENRIDPINPVFGSRNFPDYFRAIVTNGTSNGRFGVTVDPFRFQQLPELIDLGAVFPPGKAVFFWLTRRDLVGQAWSYAKAKKGGLWHEYTDGGEERTEAPEAALGPRAAISDVEWWRELIYILYGEQRMERHFTASGIAPHRLDYETLIADREGTVSGMLRALSCTEEEIAAQLPSLADTTRQHRYDDWQEANRAFRERYAAELGEIETARAELDIDQFWWELGQRHSLAFWD